MRAPAPESSEQRAAAPANVARLSLRVQSERLVSGGAARVYWLIAAIWIGTNALFWGWWLQPERVAVPALFVLLTLAFAYEGSIVPTFYLFLIGRMRKPRPLSPPTGRKVALITPCVPSSESLEVIERQLEALSRVQYAHDSWVLDEGNDPAVRAAAARFGVRYFTRKDVARYNQAAWPFKARTKAGNINAWVDAHGRDYEFLVQLDIDHVPVPHYLDRVLGYFRDPGVAWVQAPSLYGNLDNWIARGAAEQDRMWQDPIQKGFFGACETPLIINSHCTYRVSALLEIGGFQQTRSEDHLNMVALAARGYRGVYISERLAVGLGPETVDTYLQQQFAWAEAMTQILVQYMPKYFRRFGPLQLALLLYNQSWYPLSSLSKLVLFAVPLVALATGQQPANAPLPIYALTSVPAALVGVLIPMWTRRWQQPAELDFTWRGAVLTLARWPITLWACVAAVLRIKYPYQITAKGEGSTLPRLSLRTHWLHVAGAWVALLLMWRYVHLDVSDDAQGQLIWAFLGAVSMLAALLTHVLTDVRALRGLGIAAIDILRLRSRALLTTAVTTIAALATLGVGGQLMAEAFVWTGTATQAQVAAEDQPRWQELLLSGVALSDIEPVATPMPADGGSEAIATTVASAPVAAEDSADADTEVQGVTAPVAPLCLPSGQLSIGAYDPWLQLTTSPLNIEHWYVHQDDPDLLAAALLHARNQRTPLITVEPWPGSRQRTPTLDWILAGRSDDDLRRLAQVVRSADPQIVLLRWGHEMDLSGLYPWSANNPDIYRAAFRHVVEIFRAEGASNVRWVWSPAGDLDAANFYPGDDMVDYVGLTVLGDEGWDHGFGLPRQSFAQLLEPRYRAVESIDKPIIVAEVGVSGSEQEQLEWLTAARQTLEEFPRIRAAVYFDDRNAPNNRLPTQPDWRITPAIIQSLVAGAAANDELERAQRVAGSEL